MYSPTVSRYAQPSHFAYAMAGDYASLVVATRGVEFNAEGALGSRIALALADAYDDAWNAWYAIADRMLETDELVATLTDGAALEFEPESESFTGEWLKDEYGIPYFRVYREENPFLA